MRTIQQQRSLADYLQDGLCHEGLAPSRTHPQGWNQAKSLYFATPLFIAAVGKIGSIEEVLDLFKDDRTTTSPVMFFANLLEIPFELTWQVENDYLHGKPVYKIISELRTVLPPADPEPNFIQLANPPRAVTEAVELIRLAS